MKCPQCGREMMDGFLTWGSGNSLDWVPELKAFGFLDKDAELLWPTIQSFTKSGGPASICKPCKKVVFEYGDFE